MTTLTFALSAAGRWVHCPGSVRLAAEHPLDDPDPRRAEGTEAHRVAAALVTDGELLPGVPGPPGEMADGAILFATEVAARLPNPGTRRVEKYVRASSIHPNAVGQPDVYGVADRVLHVISYKYGHRKVEAFENWQNMAEAIAVLDAMGAHPPVDEVEITVVQPRYFGPGGPARSWRTPVAALGWARGELHGAALLAECQEPATQVGDYCRTCPARHACATLQAACADVADYAGTATPFALTPQQAGTELTALKRAAAALDARMSGLEVEVSAALVVGQGVPGWQMQRSDGRERWKRDSVGVVAEIATALGHNIHKPSELVTPAQARKIGLPPAVVSAHAERPRGEPKLVPADTTQTRQIFGGSK